MKYGVILHKSEYILDFMLKPMLAKLNQYNDFIIHYASVYDKYFSDRVESLKRMCNDAINIVTNFTNQPCRSKEEIILMYNIVDTVVRNYGVFQRELYFTAKCKGHDDVVANCNSVDNMDHNIYCILWLNKNIKKCINY